ncbi:MAG: discoidin domain-containing protein [Lachnospiraceae bacterium]|nr:discoidin domain-containing protein [Lachnospiraceae bacterium]
MSNIRKTVKYRRIFLSLLLCAALLTTQLSAVAFAADIGDPDEAASSAGTEMASGQEEDESENEGEYMPEGTGSGESEPENENLPDEADSQEGETGEGGLPEGTDTGSENAGTEDENLEQDLIVSDSAKTVMETVTVSGNEETEQVNLALGLLSDSANYTYEITGGGTGYDSTGTYKDDGTRYTVAELENESLYRLTDGGIINVTSVYFYDGWEPELWNNTESLRSKYIEIYRNDFRILTIDLGETSNINQVRMHFGAVEDYGIYMPTEVAFYASEDGETYYLIQNVNVNDTSEDPNDANVTCASGTQAPYHLWFETDDVNYNARYIKIVFPVNVYIFSDEMQVLGYTSAADDADDLTSNDVYDADSREVGSYASTEQTGGVKNE